MNRDKNQRDCQKSEPSGEFLAPLVGAFLSGAEEFAFGLQSAVSSLCLEDLSD